MATDPLDTAAEYQAAMNERALKEQRAASTHGKPSRETCLDCDVEIPLKRRAIGGVQRCTECEGYYQQEQRQRGYSR